MADVQQQSRANGVHSGSKRKQSVDASAAAEPPALLKKMKTKSEAPPEVRLAICCRLLASTTQRLVCTCAHYSLFVRMAHVTMHAQANPNTMAAVKERNRAMELDLREKNRRIAYLTSKCEALYRSRAVADTSFRCVRRQWLQLHDDLTAALATATSEPSQDASDTWRSVVDAAGCFGLLRMPAAELQLSLPEWYLAVGKDGSETADADASATDESTSASATDNREQQDDATSATAFVAPEDLSPVERNLHDELLQRHKDTQALLTKILQVVQATPAASSDAKTLELQSLAAAKRAAVAHALALTDQVQSVRLVCMLVALVAIVLDKLVCVFACELALVQYRERIRELESDVQAKEVERHRACREFDRLSHYVERNAASLIDPADAVAVQKTEAASQNATDASSSSTSLKSAAASNGDVKLEAQDASAAAEELAQKDKMLATLRENQTILATKLYTERTLVGELKAELERFRALEATV